MLYSRCIEALAWARSLADDRRSTLAAAATSSEAGRKPASWRTCLIQRLTLWAEYFRNTSFTYLNARTWRARPRYPQSSVKTHGASSDSWKAASYEESDAVVGVVWGSSLLRPCASATNLVGSVDVQLVR